MLGEEDHADAAAAEPVEDLVRSEDQPVSRARQDATELIFGENTHLHERFAEQAGVGKLRQAIVILLEKRGNGMPVEQVQLDQTFEKRLAGPRQSLGA